MTKGDVLNWTDLLTYMREGESSTRKFFSHIDDVDELGSTIVALANTDGGMFFVGIDLKNYHLWGTSISREWIEITLKKNCSEQVELDIHFIERNDKLILVGKVLEGCSKPYYYKNTCYIMDGHHPKVALLDKVNNRFGDLEELSEESYNQEDLNSITDELLSLTSSSDAEIENYVETDKKIEIDYMSQEAPLMTMDITAQSVTETSLDALTEVIPKTIRNTTVEEKEPAPAPIKENTSLNKRQNETLVFLDGNEFIKNKMYRELFDVSHKTAHIELVDLVKKGFLESVGSGRSTRYITSTKELMFDSL
jgi:predicted HTH transcriptional regulator